jgi:glycosyltransferase involved in cell wall biosynthesis
MRESKALPGREKSAVSMTVRVTPVGAVRADLSGKSEPSPIWMTKPGQTQADGRPGPDGPIVPTVIVPFHQNLGQLQLCLSAIRESDSEIELIVAADGAVDDCRQIAAAYRAAVVEIPGPLGPAAARNRAAASAHGNVLIFVDSDVVVAPGAIQKLCAVLESCREVAGVFGAYDEAPAETNFSSRYRNLSHSYVHQQASAKAFTFWSGLGAMRTEAFFATRGFDERFRRPSIEDIELGYRLCQAGYELRVEPAARGRHLKRWTFWSGVVTDVRDRGVPWMQLILRSGRLANDLNLTRALRLSVVLSYLLLAALLASAFAPASALVALGSLAALVGINRDYYRWFYRREGLLFTGRAVISHVVHHLCNGVSVVVGTVLSFATRLGVRLPSSSLPLEPWSTSARQPRDGSERHYQPSPTGASKTART